MGSNFTVSLTAYLYPNDHSDSLLHSQIAMPVDTNGICYVAGTVDDVSCIGRIVMIVILKMTIVIIIECMPIRKSLTSNGTVQTGESLY